MENLLGKRKSPEDEIKITEETVKMSYKELLERRKKLKMGDSYNPPPTHPQPLQGGLGMMQPPLAPLNPNFGGNLFMRNPNPSAPVLQPSMMPIMPQGGGLMPPNLPFGQSFFQNNSAPQMGNLPPINPIPNNFGFIPNPNPHQENHILGQNSHEKERIDKSDFVFKNAN